MVTCFKLAGASFYFTKIQKKQIIHGRKEVLFNFDRHCTLMNPEETLPAQQTQTKCSYDIAEILYMVIWAWN